MKVDPLSIMLNRFQMPKQLEELVGIKAVWKCMYRSWRSEQREKVFPDGQVLTMTKKSDPGNYDLDIDWIQMG